MPFCFKCGAEISEDTVFCKACGNKVEITKASQTQAVHSSLPGKSMTTVLLLAFLLGLVIWGIGHLYIGSTTRGIVFLCSSVILNIIGFVVGVATFGVGFIFILIIGLAGYLFQGFDARSQAKQLGIT